MEERILGPSGGMLFLGVYGAVLIALTVWLLPCGRFTQSSFLLAGRSVGVLRGAMSVAASWIWAPALFLSSQKAYEQGVAGLFWFTLPNFLSLVVFAPLALKIRQVLPTGYTLPQYIRLRHGRGVHVLYLIQVLGLQLCSFAVQILAGSALIQSITGLSFSVVAVVLVLIVVTYSVIGGFQASVNTDFIQMASIIIGMLIVVPIAVANAGGLSAVSGGFGGVSGAFANPIDPWVAYSFGIPVTIGLLSGPIGDQQHWQRAYAIARDKQVITTFVLGAVIFVTVPLTLSLLGFLAANPQVSGGWVIASPQMVGPISASHLVPSVVMLVFAVMLLSGLCSTLDSVLAAASSIVSVDLFGSVLDTDPRWTHENTGLRTSRIGMLVVACIGLLIALIPGLKILHLFLFYGTWRASTMIPTILTLFWPQLASRATFAAILGSLVFGAPVLAAGQIIGNPHVSVIGSLLVPTIGVSVCILGTKLGLKHSRQASAERSK